jgi:hypothetical protein
MQSSMIEGTFVAPRGPLDLYDFVKPEDHLRYREHGILPWWTSSDLKLRFWRPLASAARFAEQRWLGPRPELLHVHSWLWWAVAVVSAHSFFRRIVSVRAALLATAIFALGAWHALPLAWLANREVLLTLAAGVWALGAQLAWHEHARPRTALAAASAYALAMGTGEYALCFAGYSLLLALSARSGFVARALGFATFALPAGVYLGFRTALGYGTRGSSFYLDPLSQPWELAAQAPRRLLVLVGEGWLTLQTDVWGTTLPATALAVLVAGAAALWLGTWPRAVAALDERPRRLCVALLAGSLLALLPVLAVAPAPRLFPASALGMALALAVLLDHAWFGEAKARGARTELTRAVATLFAFLHLVHGPGSAWLTSRALRASARAFLDGAARLGATMADRSSTRVIVLRGMGGSLFGSFALDERGAAPASWQVLALTGHVLLLRTGPRTLELVASKGAGLYPCARASGNLFRDRGRPFAPGEPIRIAGAEVRVLEVEGECVRRISATFEHELEDPRYRWLQERMVGLVELTLPAEGHGAPLDP